jgi:isopentenyl-diphosphate delta-isomerase
MDMEDLIILVDIFDKEIGHGEKLQVHQNRQLHRAFSVFIINEGKMLIHQRKIGKYHSGGLWTNACCSHPRVGENLETAVNRRLIEELNISCGTEELFSFVYYDDYGELAEYEYDHVLLGEYKGEVSYNEEEIEAIKWVSFSELKEDLEKHPERYSTWFLIAAPKVLYLLDKDSQ